MHKFSNTMPAIMIMVALVGCITGCVPAAELEAAKASPVNPDVQLININRVDVFKDPTNGCEYITNHYNSTGFTPRYRADGTQICGK
jgi:hypothetical protein